MSEPVQPGPAKPINAFSVELENADIPPVSVDGAQGVLFQKDLIKIMFYSDRLKALPTLGKQGELSTEKEGKTRVSVSVENPFGLDRGEVNITRRVEAHLIFTVSALESIVPWLQERLDEMRLASESDD